jgi:PmbA protein
MRDEFKRAYEIAETAARSLGIRDLEVLMVAHSEALTRFANNAIHQNVAEKSRALSVRVVKDQRTARATTNRVDPDAIRRTVEEAVALTRASEADPALLPLFESEAYDEKPRFDAVTADATPGRRAQAVAKAIRIIESAGQTAAGICSTMHTVEALFNSTGLAECHVETMANFSITALAPDSSGWAKASAVGLADLDPEALAQRACRKAAQSSDPVELPPGSYTVVLEPAAVLDLVGQMFGDFSATAVTDQRSFLNDRLGTRLFGENITIYDDVRHPLQSGTPYDGEGVPRKRLTLVDNGVVRDLAYSRASAAKAGVAPTGHGFPLPNEVGEAPHNIVMEGGDTTLQEMIASVSRGILVTRLWYIREVDPYEKIMTGMTRDGTFLIENGRVVRGIRNFRFNQGLIELLNNVEALSVSARASGEEAFDMVMPAMLARNFQFTEVTRF